MYPNIVPGFTFEMKSFIRLNTTKRLKIESFNAYKTQKKKTKESYKEAAVRRILRLSICNIIAIEHLDIWAEKSIRKQFGIVKFPFYRVGDFKIKSAFMKRTFASCLIFIDSYVLDAITKLKAIQVNSKKFSDEEDFKRILVDDIIATLFEGSKFFLKGEFKQKLASSKVSEMYILDYAFILKSSVFSSKIGEEIYENLSEIPLTIIECGKDPLLPQFSHKDSSKIANSMSIALMDLIRCFSFQPIEFLSQLFVQGILMGGFDVEFLVMKPEFSSLAKDDDSQVHVSFLLSSSRNFSRFSFFDNGIYNPDLSRLDVFCSLKQGYLYNPPEAANMSQAASTNIVYDEKSWSELVKEIDRLDSKSLQSLLDDEEDEKADEPLDGKRQRLAGPNTMSFYFEPENWDTIPTHNSEIQAMIAHQLSRTDRNINYNSLYALSCVRKMADSLVLIIKKGLDATKDPKFPDQPFNQNENALRIYRKSRSRSSSVNSTPTDQHPSKNEKHVNTPAGENNENLDLQSSFEKPMKPPTRLRSKYKTFIDSDGSWVTVTKHDSPFELAVYLHPLIRESRLVPRLHPGIEPKRSIDRRSLTLTIEEIYPLRRFGRNRSDSHIKCGYSRFLMDGLEALTLLHEAGFVHSDISPNNIGFNERLGNWQIFDFDQARPIEDSLKLSRKGGTEHFISQLARETGIFRPIDDFIALANCICRRALPKDFDLLFDFKKFGPLLREISRSSEVNSNWLLKARELASSQ